jgi:hypothetical protein
MVFHEIVKNTNGKCGENRGKCERFDKKRRFIRDFMKIFNQIAHFSTVKCRGKVWKIEILRKTVAQ